VGLFGQLLHNAVWLIIFTLVEHASSCWASWRTLFSGVSNQNGKESFRFDLKPRQLKPVVAEIVHGNQKDDLTEVKVFFSWNSVST